MIQALQDFIENLTVISNDGMLGTTRDALKVFYVSNHGLTAENIYERLQNRNDKRTLATPRLLGLVDNNLEYTEIGKLFISKCSDKRRIFYNQYKKWHFPNSVAFKNDAKLFDIYPYWIILEFLVIAKKKDIIDITRNEFMVFIATIRHRHDILKHLKNLIILRENPQITNNFYKNYIPDSDNLQKRFDKSGFGLLINECLEYLKYSDIEDAINLEHSELEQFINMITYFYDEYDLYNNYKSDSLYFEKFLSKNIIDNNFNLFPMTNNFSTESYKSVSSKIKNDFRYLNILLKGVPGTGKSRMVEQIINDNLFKLKPDEQEDECLNTSNLKNQNVIRINIHSGLSNAELMQGIGVSTTDSNDIKYYEKRGIILKHIAKAILNPSLPYVIILEEVQENNLNLLIGDLIFLIEKNRRVEFETDYINKIQGQIDFGFVSDLVLEYSEHDKILLPSLVEDSKETYLCLPKNLYFFCTSNYRDNKKIMEDNLLRRFEIIDLFPDYSVISNKKVGQFLKNLNDSILEYLSNNFETHPDRFLIGHANWIEVNDIKTFLQALNKVIINFKDLKELEWKSFQIIVNKTSLDISNYSSYKELLVEVQKYYLDDLANLEPTLKDSINSIINA